MRFLYAIPRVAIVANRVLPATIPAVELELPVWGNVACCAGAGVLLATEADGAFTLEFAIVAGALVFSTGAGVALLLLLLLGVVTAGLASSFST